jgi:hypothetical protein
VGDGEEVLFGVVGGLPVAAAHGDDASGEHGEREGGAKDGGGEERRDESAHAESPKGAECGRWLGLLEVRFRGRGENRN